jgi:hypothetical protein
MMCEASSAATPIQTPVSQWIRVHPDVRSHLEEPSREPIAARESRISWHLCGMSCATGEKDKGK